MPKVQSLHDTRRKHIRARIAEDASRGEDWWRAYFGRIRASPFLRGEGPPRGSGGKPFQATFDWAIFSETNVAKVLEGNYDAEVSVDGRGSAGTDGADSGGLGPSPVRFTDGLYQRG
jgi:hypothetical protein